MSRNKPPEIKQLAVDLMLINVYLQGPNKDPGGNVALDFSMVTSSVAMTYCGKSVTIKSHCMLQNFERKQSCRNMLTLTKDKHNIHFVSVVFKNGGGFEKKPWEVFNKICNLITQTSGQSRSAIVYFWKSRLLVT